MRVFPWRRSVSAQIVHHARPDCTSWNAVSHEQKVTVCYSPATMRAPGTPFGPSPCTKPASTTTARNSAKPSSGRADHQAAGPCGAGVTVTSRRRPPAPRDDQPGGGMVPDVCALLHVGVEVPGRHRADVERAGPEPPDVADPREHPCQVARLAGARRLLVAESGAGRAARVQRYDGPRPDRLPVARRPATGGRGVLEAEDGCQDDARDHLAVELGGDADREVRQPVEVVHGAGRSDRTIQITPLVPARSSPFLADDAVVRARAPRIAGHGPAPRWLGRPR